MPVAARQLPAAPLKTHLTIPCTSRQRRRRRHGVVEGEAPSDRTVRAHGQTHACFLWSVLLSRKFVCSLRSHGGVGAGRRR